jgi:hypothetical protein
VKAALPNEFTKTNCETLLLILIVDWVHTEYRRHFPACYSLVLLYNFCNFQKLETPWEKGKVTTLQLTASKAAREQVTVTTMSNVNLSVKNKTYVRGD